MPVNMPAIAIAQGGRFLVQREGLLCARRRDQVDRPLLKPIVARPEGLMRLELAEQVLTGFEPVKRDVDRKLQSGYLERGSIGVAGEPA